MNHRRYLGFLAAGALTLAAACGGKDETKGAATAERAPPPPPPPAATAATPPAPPDAPAPPPNEDEHHKGKHHKGDHDKGDHAKGEHHHGEHGAKGGGEQARAGFRWEVHKKSDLRFEVPNDWRSEEKGEVFILHSKHPGANVHLHAVEGTKVHEDEKELMVHIAKHLHDVKKSGPAHKVDQHGLRGLSTQGSGKHEGKVVDWLAAALSDGHGHQVLAIAHWEPHAPPKVKEELKVVLDSIGVAKR